eukprot:CCRYP_008049-RB/>CCRYP_008049-RB protein AED:0.02 eAED:0.02 QI:108/1/1/1/1/1/5/398/1979
MGFDEWNCPKCTFHHKFTAQRCQMCSALRVSREQMRDFVLGNKTSSSNAPTGGDFPGVAEARNRENGTKIGPATTEQSSCDEGYNQTMQSGPLHSPALENHQNSCADRAIPNPYSAGARPSSFPRSRPLVKNPYSKNGAASTTSSSGLPFHDNNSKSGSSQEGAVATATHNSTVVDRTQHRKFPLNPYTSVRKPPRGQASPSLAARSLNDGSSNSTSSNVKNIAAPTVMPNVTNNRAQHNSFALGPYSSAGNSAEDPRKQSEWSDGNPSSAARVMLSSSGQTVSNAKQSQVETSRENSIHLNRNRMMQQGNTANQCNRTTLNANQPQTDQTFDTHTEKGALNSTPANIMVQTSSMQPVNKQNQRNLHNLFSKSNQRSIERQKPSHNASSLSGYSGLLHESKNSSGAKSLSSKEPPYVEGPVPLSKNTCHNWIYPIDDKYPERSYQLQMAHTSIMTNTLVSLPTGLGKTLIAAVVMYNYYRWFPTGKVVFCAPTRPLVTQQIQACYKIMGIPELHTAEISGRSKPESREAIWKAKRVFFCTPHTLVKDIEGGRCDAESIVCVVMDEAHRATGNHANALLVNLIKDSGAKFRLVGLSATPGTDIKSIQSIITTLNISQIEAKTEDDPDVKKYIHRREEEVIIVKQPDVVNRLDKMFGELIQPILDRLRQENVGARLFSNTAALVQYTVFQAQKEYVERTNDHRLDGHFSALRELVDIRRILREHGVLTARTKLSTLYHHGRRGIFGKIIEGNEFRSLLSEVSKATRATQEDEVEGQEDLLKNNPKYEKLSELLLEHFERKQASNQDTRVIVFSQWRDSVDGIVSMLKAQNHHLLKPSPFIGQSKKSVGKKSRGSNSDGKDLAGMNQAQQQRVLEQFSKGIYNILVCTCVAEEGLDIGDVDLIVNFDILKSPIRSIQRSGRTGRKRDGRVIFLVSEGTEERSYNESVANTKKIARALQSNKNVFNFCHTSPMFPKEPTLLKQKMTVSNFRMSQVGGHTPKASKRSANAVRRCKESSSDWMLTEEQEKQRQQQFGSLPEFLTLGCDKRRCFPQSIRRDYLKARQRSVASKLHRRDGSKKDLSVGSCSRFLKDLERKYCRFNKKLSLSPLDDALAALQSTQKITTASEPGNDDASMKLSEASVVASGHSDNFDVEDLTSNPQKSNIVADELFDGIFGRGIVSHNSGIDVEQLMLLFDSNEHHCAVSPPPEFGVPVSNESDCDESDSVSAGTKSSQLSVNTMNDDLLCDFFERRGDSLGKPFLAQSQATAIIAERSCEQPGNLDFGGDSPFELGVPHIDGEDVTVDDFEPPFRSKAAPIGKSLSVESQSKETNSRKARDKQDNVDGLDNNIAHFTLKNMKEDDNADDGEHPPNRRLSIPLDFEGARPLQYTETSSAMRKVCSNSCNNDTAECEEVNECSGSHFQQRLGTIKNSECARKEIPAFLEAALSNEELSSTMLCNGSDGATNSVVALQLPTPPDSSDDSEDDSISGNSSSVAVFAPRADGSGNCDDKCAYDIQRACLPTLQLNEIQLAASNDPVEQTSCDCVVPLQLPTQYSSSSSDDGSDEEASVGCRGRAVHSDEVRKSIQGCPMTDLHEDLDYQMHPPSSLKNITNLAKQNSSCRDLVDTPTPNNLKFKSVSTHSMSPDDLTDTPINKGPNKSTGLKPRLSADGLTDTPIKCSEVSVIGPKKLGGHRKRIRSAPCDNKENQHTSITTLTGRRERVKQRIEEKYRCKFLDTEAALDGSDEDSDEEDAIKQIEEEESQNSFINDSSQLGYTQDDLDQINADEEVSEGLHLDDLLLHRQLNHQQNVAEQFKTPIFNRRMARPSLSQNVPSSQRGLGNMNFIRSILEHQRQGGDSDDIEEEYHRLIGRCSPNDSHDWSSPISIVHSPERPPHQVGSNTHNVLEKSNPSDVQSHAACELEDRQSCTAPTCDSFSHPKSELPAVLTADQKAMIEAKRLAALKRRQERMKSQHQSFPRANPYAK